MSRLTLFAALTLAASTLVVTAAEPLFGDKIVAQGKNVSVKQSEVDEALIDFKAAAAASGKPIPPQATPQVTQQIVDKMIATQIFMSRATPKDTAQGTEAAEKFIKDLMAASPSEEAFKRRLIAQGSNYEDFRKQVLEQYIVKTVIDRELSDRIQISETQLKSFYDKNQANFTEPEKVRVAHILLGLVDFATRKELSPADKVKKRELAVRVAERAKQGEDFGKLVQEFTDDRDSKAKNGEYTIVKGAGRIPVEFEGAAFTLKVGQVSDVVASPLGFHIIKCLERIPPRTAPLAEVQEKLRAALFQQEAQKLVPDHVKKIREDYQVKVDLP